MKTATTQMTAAQFVKKLKSYSSPVERKKFRRYFKCEGSDPDGDQFIGVRMGQLFALAKEFIDMPLDEVEKLLESPIHEVRAGGCSIMGKQATARKTPESRRRELYELYLRRHDRINNWDLVDLASYKVVGSYLFDFDKPRKILYKLARSKNRWERRTAIVSTLYFIRKGDVDDAFKIAELLLKDKEDLVHKGTGWALRYAGDKDRKRLLNFLDQQRRRCRAWLCVTRSRNSTRNNATHYQGMKKSLD